MNLSEQQHFSVVQIMMSVKLPNSCRRGSGTLETILILYFTIFFLILPPNSDLFFFYSVFFLLRFLTFSLEFSFFFPSFQNSDSFFFYSDSFFLELFFFLGMLIQFLGNSDFFSFFLSEFWFPFLGILIFFSSFGILTPFSYIFFLGMLIFFFFLSEFWLLFLGIKVFFFLKFRFLFLGILILFLSLGIWIIFPSEFRFFFFYFREIYQNSKKFKFRGKSQNCENKVSVVSV